MTRRRGGPGSGGPWESPQGYDCGASRTGSSGFLGCVEPGQQHEQGDDRYQTTHHGEPPVLTASGGLDYVLRFFQRLRPEPADFEPDETQHGDNGYEAESARQECILRVYRSEQIQAVDEGQTVAKQPPLPTRPPIVSPSDMPPSPMCRRATGTSPVSE